MKNKTEIFFSKVLTPVNFLLVLLAMSMWIHYRLLIFWKDQVPFPTIRAIRDGKLHVEMGFNLTPPLENSGWTEGNNNPTSKGE